MTASRLPLRLSNEQPRGHGPGPLVKIVQRDNADTEELRARNPWRSISAGPSGGWPLLPGEGDRAAGLALTIQIVA